MDNTFGNTSGVRSVDPGRGIGWWTDAWALFTKNAGLWIVLGLIMLVIFVVLSFIPVLGALAVALLAPVFTAGWMLAARKAASGQAIEVGDLFAAFKGDRLTPLLVIGGLLLAVVIVLGLVMFMFGMGAAIGMGASAGAGSAGGAAAAMGAGLLMTLVFLLVGLAVGMGFWFAPALVVLNGMAPVDAVKTSFAACLKNIVPFILYTVVYIVAAIVASIPFGLGWLVLMPLLMLTIYGSYREIFGG
jgi:uncharacterized membrane protein